MVFYTLCWYFLIYAILGWCAEVAFAAVTTGKFVNRGFLDGPYCPIYGCGVVLVLVVLSPVAGNFPLLFLGSLLLTSAIEFLVGFLLERIFHEKWWDYSDMPFNIKGYVCPKFSLMWGIACVLVVRVIHPILAKPVEWMPLAVGLPLLCVFYILILADLTGTLMRLVRMRKYLHSIEKINAELHKLSDVMGAHISDGVLEAVAANAAHQEHYEQKKEELRAKAAGLRERFSTEQGKLSAYSRHRLHDAFPHLYACLEQRTKKQDDEEDV